MKRIKMALAVLLLIATLLSGMPAIADEYTLLVGSSYPPVSEQTTYTGDAGAKNVGSLVETTTTITGNKIVTTNVYKGLIDTKDAGRVLKGTETVTQYVSVYGGNNSDRYGSGSDVINAYKDVVRRDGFPNFTNGYSTDGYLTIGQPPPQKNTRTNNNKDKDKDKSDKQDKNTPQDKVPERTTSTSSSSTSKNKKKNGVSGITSISSSGGYKGGLFGGMDDYDPPPPPPSSDLAIASITPTEYWANMPALVSVVVTNYDSDGDSGTVTLSLDGVTLGSTSIHVAAGTSNVAIFEWPDTGSARAGIKATASVSGMSYDSNSSNNTGSGTINVKARKVVQEAVTSTESSPTQIPETVPAGENTYRREWRENYTSYWAELTLEYKLDPAEKMKSGYGFALTVVAKINTNYPNKKYLYNPQELCVFIPECGYKKAVKMITSDGGTTWTLPINAKSKISEKRWYVPIWYPDKKDYKVLLTALGAYTPGGELTKSEVPSIFIDGNMYQDDYTSNY